MKKITLYKKIILMENYYDGENLSTSIEIQSTEKIIQFLSAELDELIFKYIKDK